LDAATPAAQRRALPALLLGGIVIGCSPILVRVSELGPVATAFWRLALALLPLGVAFARERVGAQPLRLPRSVGEHLLAAAPGVLLAADLAAWHTSLHLTSVAKATLLANLAPVFVTLFSWLVLRQRIGLVFFVALMLSIVGIVILQGGGAAIAGGDIRGDSMALVAAAFYAAYIMALGRARVRYSTTTIMLWTTVSAAMCTGLLAWAIEPALLPWSFSGWVTLWALAWVSQAGGQSLIAFALAWLPATLSSLTLLIQPVVASILAWLLLGESLTPRQIAGGCIVIAGIMLARRGGQTPPNALQAGPSGQS
jgi:drug/metabolite transporter (DMT)-like permease